MGGIGCSLSLFGGCCHFAALLLSILLCCVLHKLFTRPPDAFVAICSQLLLSCKGDVSAWGGHMSCPCVCGGGLEYYRKALDWFFSATAP